MIGKLIKLAIVLVLIALPIIVWVIRTPDSTPEIQVSPPEPPIILNITVGETKWTIPLTPGTKPQPTDTEALTAELKAVKEELATLTLERNQLLAKTTELSDLDYLELQRKYDTLENSYEVEHIELINLRAIRLEYNELMARHSTLVSLYEECKQQN